LRRDLEACKKVKRYVLLTGDEKKGGGREPKLGLGVLAHTEYGVNKLLGKEKTLKKKKKNFSSSVSQVGEVVGTKSAQQGIR